MCKAVLPSHAAGRALPAQDHELNTALCFLQELLQGRIGRFA